MQLLQYVFRNTLVTFGFVLSLLISLKLLLKESIQLNKARCARDLRLIVYVRVILNAYLDLTYVRRVARLNWDYICS